MPRPASCAYDPYLEGRRFGHTVAGDLVANEKEVRIVDAGQTVGTRTMATRIDVLAISPDRRRVAMIDATRFTGELVIWDVVADTIVRSARLKPERARVD